MGVGTGRNSIYLASLGFPIDAIDSAELAIHELNKYIQLHSLPIRASVQDLQYFDPGFSRYDLVLCTQILHYLSPVRALSLLSAARSNAERGAIHVIAAMTNMGDFYELCPTGKYFYPAASGIRDIYQEEGWTIISDYAMERSMRQCNKNGNHMRNLVSFLIAQKPYLYI
jgi:tellurite methyltransferase